MILSSTHQKSRPYRAFWGFIFGLILVFDLFQGFLPKTASAPVADASNVYISNISFYKTGNDLYTQFLVNTSFDLVDPWGWGGGILSSLGVVGSGYVAIVKSATGTCNFLANVNPDPTNCGTNGHCHFTAGLTYVINLNGLYSVAGAGSCWTYAYYVSKLGVPTSTHYIRYDLPNINDSQKYYFTETPSLTITYPSNNAELTANFYTTGSFTQPTSTYNFLSIFATITGTQNYIRSFDQVINFATSGSMSIWISGLSAGYYDFDLMMRNNTGGYYFADDWTITNIHIVNDLPITLPPYGGQPPTTAPTVYAPLEPSAYYTANSSYSTSTALYNTITGTFAPVLLAIGDSLTQFASNFTQSNASSTGNQIGSSILLIRSYVSNINAFFSNFPVGQFLLLYLIALIVVIVLRLVKGVIGLFKL